MEETTPRQRLLRSLERAAKEVQQWPLAMRQAVSTANVFHVAQADAPPAAPRQPIDAPDSK